VIVALLFLRLLLLCFDEPSEKWGQTGSYMLVSPISIQVLFQNGLSLKTKQIIHGLGIFLTVKQQILVTLLERRPLQNSQIVKRVGITEQ